MLIKYAEENLISNKLNINAIVCLQRNTKDSLTIIKASTKQMRAYVDSILKPSLICTFQKVSWWLVMHITCALLPRHLIRNAFVPCIRRGSVRSCSTVNLLNEYTTYHIYSPNMYSRYLCHLKDLTRKYWVEWKVYYKSAYLR